VTIAEVNDLLSHAIGPGWVATNPYYKGSSIQTVQPNANLDLISETLPGGAGLFITDVWMNNIDGVGIDYLIWTARQNGVPLPGMDTLIGSPMPGFVSQPLDAILMPGLRFSMNAVNLSGSGAGFPDALATRVAAIAKGWYIRWMGLI
jgi:hypothetical protein